MDTSRTYRLVESTRANDLFGATRTTTVERVTVEGDGVRVERHVHGTIEGERIDRRACARFPGVTLEAAHNWRLRNGYSVVAS
jgi:hypothetical protein